MSLGTSSCGQLKAYVLVILARYWTRIHLESGVQKKDLMGIKGANKDAEIYVGRSTTFHNLLFCAYTLCANYVTNTFLLVSSSGRSKQLLCFVHGQGLNSEQKHATKNFVGFHNHCTRLTSVNLE